MKKSLSLFLLLLFFVPLMTNAKASDYCDGLTNCAYCEYTFTDQAREEVNDKVVAVDACKYDFYVVYKNGFHQVYAHEESFKGLNGYECSGEFHLKDTDFVDDEGKLTCPNLNPDYGELYPLGNGKYKIPFYIVADEEGRLTPNSQSKIYNVSNVEEPDVPNKVDIPVCMYYTSCGSGFNFSLYTQNNEVKVCSQNSSPGFGIRKLIDYNSLAQTMKAGACPDLYYYQSNDTCEFFLESNKPHYAYLKAEFLYYESNPNANLVCDTYTQEWYPEEERPEDPEVEMPELTPQTCDSLLGSPNPEEGEPNTPAYYLSLVFSIIRYAAIMLLIVLTIMDFVGAVASHDNDIMKKAVSKAAKRAILCVIIFLLPTLIDFILQFVHESSIKECIGQ